MNACDQHLFVVGPVENADPSSFRKIRRGAPKKIMKQLGGAGMLEAEHLASLRIDLRHHMPDGAILSRRIHRLKDQQDCVTVGCIMKPLRSLSSRRVLPTVPCSASLIVYGSMFVGHFPRSTLCPSRTRKSFECIFSLLLHSAWRLELQRLSQLWLWLSRLWVGGSLSPLPLVRLRRPRSQPAIAAARRARRPPGV